MSLEFIYLFTPDLTASKDWYKKVLKIEPTMGIENFVEFRLNGNNGLCLHHADAKSPLSTGGSVGYWKVMNFNATIEHFKMHGVKIYRGPLKIENGKTICQILDPIGNVIGLIG